MRQLQKKFLIKIPNDVQVYYHSNKTSIVFKTSLKKKNKVRFGFTIFERSN